MPGLGLRKELGISLRLFGAAGLLAACSGLERDNSGASSDTLLNGDTRPGCGEVFPGPIDPSGFSIKVPYDFPELTELPNIRAYVSGFDLGLHAVDASPEVKIQNNPNYCSLGMIGITDVYDDLFYLYWVEDEVGRRTAEFARSSAPAKDQSDIKFYKLTLKGDKFVYAKNSDGSNVILGKIELAPNGDFKTAILTLPDGSQVSVDIREESSGRENPGLGSFFTVGAALAAEETQTPIPTSTRAPDALATAAAADKFDQLTPPPPAPTKISEWQPAVGRDLPPIHRQNARFIPLDDGSAEIVFRAETGREYGLHIPRPADVIDGAGSPVQGAAITAEFFRPAPARLEQTPPRIALVDENGEEMAWFNAAAGEWTRRYETLFTLDSWPEFPGMSWIEGSLGFENYRQASQGPEYINEFYLTVSGRIKRVYTEKVFYPAERRFMELTWASVTYDKAGQKTLETILFTDVEFPSNPSPGSAQRVQIVTDSDGYTGFIPLSLSYTNRRILAAARGGAFALMKFGFSKDSSRSGADFYAADLKWLFKFGYESIIRDAVLGGKYWDQHRGLFRAMIADDLDRSELKELDRRLEAQGYRPAESGVRIGFLELWIFAPSGGG